MAIYEHGIYILRFLIRPTEFQLEILAKSTQKTHSEIPNTVSPRKETNASAGKCTQKNAHTEPPAQEKISQREQWNYET